MSDDPILAALQRLEAGQATMRSDFLDEMGKTRNAIMEKVEGLQESLTALDEGVNNAQRVNEDMRSLRVQVSSTWRELKALEAKMREITRDS